MDQTFSQYQQAGQLVNFTYTFSQRQIDFVYLEDDVAFEQLLNNPLIKIASQRLQYGVRTIYTLTNGMILVQEPSAIRNRYFLCKSEDDYSFILYHVIIYKEGDRLVTYGVSTNNAEIVEYLKREDPFELTRLSYINARVLKNKQGNIIIISVGYKRPVFDIKTPFKPLKEENKNYNFSDRSFLSCRIYQSMNDAKANGGLPHEEEEIDKDNF